MIIQDTGATVADLGIGDIFSDFQRQYIRGRRIAECADNARYHETDCHPDQDTTG